MKSVQTIALIISGNQILLGMKKKGFGAGRWNGFGGKINSGETVYQGMRRELLEEVGIESLTARKCGVIEFSFEKDPDLRPEVHIFIVTKWRGEPIETDEMRPSWFLIEDIPYEMMWPGDREWLPISLAGNNFQGKIHFGDHNTVLDCAITRY